MSVRPIATIACAHAVLLQAGCAGRATRPAVTQVEVSLAARSPGATPRVG